MFCSLQGANIDTKWSLPNTYQLTSLRSGENNTSTMRFVKCENIVIYCLSMKIVTFIGDFIRIYNLWLLLMSVRSTTMCTPIQADNCALLWNFNRIGGSIERSIDLFCYFVCEIYAKIVERYGLQSSSPSDYSYQ